MSDPSPGTTLEDAVRAGRAASRVDLRRRLSSAPAAFLDGAVDNPTLGPAELLLLLRNREARGTLLQRIAGRPDWMRRHEVRRLLVHHPNAPLALARRLLPHLYWKDLAGLTLDPRSHPVVRRDAERRLGNRVEDLSSGEKISLARRAPRGVLTRLLHSADPRIVRGLLGNPRLIEADAARIAGDSRRGGEILALLGNHPTWGVRRSIRLALVRNPRTPVPVALRALAQLAPRDLRPLIDDSTVPRVVRVSAARRIGGATSAHRRGPVVG